MLSQVQYNNSYFLNREMGSEELSGIAIWWQTKNSNPGFESSPPTVLYPISYFSSKSHKALLITASEEEAVVHYLFPDFQIFNIIPCPRRTLQGTIITIQYFGENETTAGPANHHGNTSISTSIMSTKKHFGIHMCSIFVLNCSIIHWLADDTTLAQVKLFSISSKTPPSSWMILRIPQAHR